jgi:hypothetical protein
VTGMLSLNHRWWKADQVRQFESRTLAVLAPTMSRSKLSSMESRSRGVIGVVGNVPLAVNEVLGARSFPLVGAALFAEVSGTDRAVGEVLGANMSRICTG